MLLNKRANIEATDNDGYTPLIDACRNGRVEAMKLLLARDAKIEATNNYGLTLLHHACE